MIEEASFPRFFSCQSAPKRRWEKDRAFLARQLIASLDITVDLDAETQWHEVIDRRSQEIEHGKVSCRPGEQVVQDIRSKLDARRQPS